MVPTCTLTNSNWWCLFPLSPHQHLFSSIYNMIISAWKWVGVFIHQACYNKTWCTRWFKWQTFFLFLFNWGIVDLWYCANFTHTAKWLNYVYIILQIFIFLQFWRLEVQDEGAGGIISPEVSLPGWQMTVFSLGPHVAFSLCAQPWCLFFFL